MASADVVGGQGGVASAQATATGTAGVSTPEKSQGADGGGSSTSVKEIQQSAGVQANDRAEGGKTL